MMRNRLKFTAWLAMVLLVVTLLPTSVLAADASSTTLEQAIQKVKQNFVIPAGCTEFSSNYSEADNRKLLSLNWTSPQGDKGYFNAQVDLTTGEIIGMSQWKPVTPGQTTQIPVLSIAQARDLGEKMLARLIPSRIESLRPIASNQLMSLTSYSSPSCSLRWQRYAGGIPVSGDTVNMEVDLVTGQVNSFYLNWTSLNLPATTDGAVTAEQARQAFIDAGMLELNYQIPTFFRPLSATGEPEKAPYLVYQISHPSGGLIDALTGKPLVLEAGHYVTDAGGYGGLGGMAKAESPAAQDAVQLTPQEQSEVDRTAQLISQQQAEAVVKRLVISQFGDGFTLRNINLEQDWRNPTQKAWSLNWTSPSSSEGQSGPSLYARVNAATGELVSFSYDSMSSNSGKDKLSKEEAQKIGEEFIKLAAPTRADELRLSPLSSVNTYRYPASPYNFQYQRLVNDIPCPGNGITVNVDPVTGKVVYFSLDWNEGTFPPATSVIGSEKAYSLFNQFAPLTLTYSPEWGPQGLTAMRLVYRPTPAQDLTNTIIIDAVKGMLLDSQGKPLVTPPQAFSFSDIQGAYGEKEISILGQAGLMGEYGSAFKPEEAVTLVSLLRAMQGCRNGVYTVNSQTDEEIMKQARDSGLIKENHAPTTVVTREMFSILLTRYLGVEYLAQLSGIYKTTWRDVPPSLTGYTALVTGLSLFEVKGSNFEPSKAVTRSQAAVALVRALPRLNAR